MTFCCQSPLRSHPINLEASFKKDVVHFGRLDILGYFITLGSWITIDFSPDLEVVKIGD
jgi:hypothetical protein